MYKNYFFDLYGTLMEVRTNQEKECVWEKMSLYYGYYGAYYDPFEFKSRYNEITKKLLAVSEELEYPEIDIQEVFYKLFKDKNVRPKKRMSKDAAKVFRLLATEGLEIYDGVINMLEVLAKNKKKMYILANAQNVYALYEMRHGQIRRFFEDYIFSSDIGVCKPDKTIIESTFDDKDIRKEDSIIISASYSDILVANECNIDTLHINLEESKGREKSKATFEVQGRNYEEITNLLLE